MRTPVRVRWNRARWNRARCSYSASTPPHLPLFSSSISTKPWGLPLRTTNSVMPLALSLHLKMTFITHLQILLLLSAREVERSVRMVRLVEPFRDVLCLRLRSWSGKEKGIQSFCPLRQGVWASYVYLLVLQPHLHRPVRRRRRRPCSCPTILVSSSDHTLNISHKIK
jgi:hypothetical protein